MRPVSTLRPVQVAMIIRPPRMSAVYSNPPKLRIAKRASGSETPASTAQDTRPPASEAVTPSASARAARPFLAIACPS